MRVWPATPAAPTVPAATAAPAAGTATASEENTRGSTPGPSRSREGEGAGERVNPWRQTDKRTYVYFIYLSLIFLISLGNFDNDSFVFETRSITL